MILFQSKIIENLSRIRSTKPFQIIYYGSKERGDFNDLSDYNFYLLAYPHDQIKSSFIKSIADSLNILESQSPVSLIAGDVDSFRYRMKLFDPTVVHLLEMGKLFFGRGEFQEIQQEWTFHKSKPINFPSLIKYIENRSRFYRNLEPKSNKEDIARIEKVICLNVQSWILKSIKDISITELVFMDIPKRLISLIRYLYKRETNQELQILISIYEEIHELKQNLKFMNSYSEEQLIKIKGSISQIQELSNSLQNQNCAHS